MKDKTNNWLNVSPKGDLPITPEYLQKLKNESPKLNELLFSNKHKKVNNYTHGIAKQKESKCVIL